MRRIGLGTIRMAALPMRLHDFLEFHARIRPEADFAVMGARTMSYRDADAAANRLANAMAAAGLRVGDRVAVLSKNCIEYLVIYFACAKAGIVPVPLNYRLAPPEWAYIIEDAGARLLFARGELVEAIAPVRSELELERFVAIEAEADGWESLAAFTAGHPESDPDRGVTDEHDLYQMYTSGTTGRPKGAVLQHRALAANIQQAQLTFHPRPGERTLIVAPMYHVAAGITMFTSLATGGCVYVQEDFNPAEVVRALSEERIGMALLVPVMIQLCLVHVPDVAARSYADLRLIVYGGSAIAEQTLRNALATFRCDFLQGYGMTELTALATNLLPEDHRRALAGEPGLLVSAGRALAGTEVRVVDAEDRPVPPGSIGEVVVRGPQAMRGYWNRPDATAEALRGGFMHTGDAGTMDEAGYLYIQDRVKDMIVTGGENVYPREIEELLYQHPAVAEAAVIGVPDPTWGEAIKAIVVLRAGMSATAEELVEGLEGKLADYKHPRSVDFVAALPRNPSGKVLKRELREPYWQGHSRRVGG
jgi:acyl-CoA synthetase (AMP-forming)/AMP-acid ligase II